MPTRYLRYRCGETGRVCFLDERGQNYWCPYHGDHKVERDGPFKVPAKNGLIVEPDDDDA